MMVTMVKIQILIQTAQTVMTKKIVIMMMWLTLLVMMITIVLRMMIELMGHQIVVWVMKQTVVKNSM